MVRLRVILTLAALAGVLAVSMAQEPAPPANPAPLSPDQLDTLVAPIALYPDSLLSQILAASTYPLEIVELGQWLQQNPGLKGEALIDAARNQGWDPSIAALAAFPDVVKNLNRDIKWTRDLGDAFLAQQADVMSAVQRMRARAQSNGKLQTNSQIQVNTQTENGQNAIVIQPANPDVIYVPEYDPAWVWGPPLVGFYPPLWYPGITVGFGFLPGIYLGGFFGGCCGWGFGWGWGPDWFGGGIFVNNYFSHRYGFGDLQGGAFEGRGVWAHNGEHRLGVPYPNRGLAERFHGAGPGGFNRGAAGGERGFGGGQRGFGGGQRGFGGGERGFGGGERGVGGGGNFRGGESGRAPSERFGSEGFERANPGGNHSVLGCVGAGGAARMQSDHGFSSIHGGGFGGGGGAHGFGGGGGGFHGGGGGRR